MSSSAADPIGDRRTHVTALLAAFCSGMLLALQSRMNGEVSSHTGQPLLAALWSFGTGLLVLTAGALFVPAMRRGVARIAAAVRHGRLRWFQCLGGVVGGLLVATQAWSIPLIGVTIFSVAVVGGQTLNALLVDRFGLGPAGVQRVTGVRVLAALVAVVGVLISATAKSGGQLRLWPALCVFVIGTGLAVQQAFNGRVSVAGSSPMATTWQNFLVGSVTLLLVSGGVLAANGSAGWAIPHGVPLWALPGGLVGIVFIAMTAWGVRITGVLVFGLLSVAGQLLAAVGLDLLGSATRHLVGVQVLVGLAVTLVAAAGAGLARGR